MVTSGSSYALCLKSIKSTPVKIHPCSQSHLARLSAQYEYTTLGEVPHEAPGQATHLELTIQIRRRRCSLFSLVLHSLGYEPSDPRWIKTYWGFSRTKTLCRTLISFPKDTRVTLLQRFTAIPNIPFAAFSFPTTTSTHYTTEVSPPAVCGA